MDLICKFPNLETTLKTFNEWKIKQTVVEYSSAIEQSELPIREPSRRASREVHWVGIVSPKHCIVCDFIYRTIFEATNLETETDLQLPRKQV